MYGPKESGFLASTSEGKAFPLQSALDSGYPVAQFTADLGPGESKTVVIDMLGKVPFSGDILAQITPTISQNAPQALTVTCETALE